jgi:catechol 2,3-dioxygenase-like lactoylglutathione lyase family enzyme
VPRLWRWAKAVATERVDDAPVPIFLERTDAEGYRFRLGVRAGFGGQETARIEVRRRLNPDPHPMLKEIHSCEVAGRTLEAANVHALRAKVAALLNSIAPARTLPLCYFRAPAMGFELAVYENDGRITAPTIGGPKLRAGDLATMRRHVCRYLVSAGYVADAEDVQVLVLRPRDLRLVEPAAVFRCTADPELWVPCVDGVSPEGPVVGVLGQAARLRDEERVRAGAGPAVGESAPAAPDAVSLLRYVRLEVARERRALDPATVYGSDVRPDQWALADARLRDTGRRLVAHLADDEATRLELSIRESGAGEIVTAVEDRAIGFFSAASESELAATVGAYLAGHGFLRFADEVEVHAAPEPRAERLEPAAIRSPFDDFHIASQPHQEAHA